jgi:hypothetical protein
VFIEDHFKVKILFYDEYKDINLPSKELKERIMNYISYLISFYPDIFVGGFRGIPKYKKFYIRFPHTHVEKIIRPPKLIKTNLKSGDNWLYKVGEKSINFSSY